MSIVMSQLGISAPLQKFYAKHHTAIVRGVKTVYYDSNPEEAVSQQAHIPTVIALHGMATSSYLYRDLIANLSKEIRLIVPDLPGFGFSQKQLPWSATAKNYLAWLESFIDEVIPKEQAIHFVVNDFGALVGLAWAIAHKNRVASLLITNTYLHLEYLIPPLWLPASCIPLMGSALVEKVSTPGTMNRLMRKCYGEPVSTSLMSSYTYIYQNKEARRMLANFLWHIHKFPQFIWSVRRQLMSLDVSTRILFGAKDPFHRQGHGEKLAHSFPNGSYRLLPNIGYFPPDESPDIVRGELESLISVHPI